MLNRALSLHQSGNLGEAENLYRDVLKIEPNNHDALHLRGVIQLQTGRFDVAADLLERAIAAFGRNPDFYLHYAAALKELGRLADAADAYRKMLKLTPKNVDALHDLGVILLTLQEFPEATKFLKKAVRIQPKSPELLNTLAITLQAAGKISDAIDALGRALAINANAPELQNNYGNLLHKVGRLDDALSALDRAISMRPDYAEAHFNRGLVYHDLGELGQAVPAFQRCVALTPGDAEAWYSLGVSLMDMGSKAEAVQAFEKAAGIDPKMAKAHDNIGFCLQDIGQLDEALAAYDKAVAIDPDFGSAYRNKGSLLHELKRHDEALAAHRRALDLDPDDLMAKGNLGATLLQSGDAEAAIEVLESRLAVDPGHTLTLAHKAIALCALGRKGDYAEFVDVDQLVTTREFEVPEPYGSMTEFNAALVDHVLRHPSLVYEPFAQGIRKGQQTGELLVDPLGPMAAFEQMVRAEIETYMADGKGAAAHPFFETVPKNWRLTVWATVLNAEGHHIPHIHMAGWLSGVYYPKLPEVITAGGDQKFGWLELNHPPSNFPVAELPETTFVQPREGMAVFFPSFMYHGTIPYTESQERISIAFDVLPE